MNYIQWLKGNDCCEQINDCGCSGKDVCNCEEILLEISKLHTDDEILQNEIDNIASGSSVTVDDHLDSASTNPAQNKVITEALNGKLDASAYTPTDLSNYYTKEEVNSAITEVENDIPSLSGYATEQWVLDKNYITGVDLSNYATLQDIPVVPTDVSAFNNDAGYLTEHQSLSAYSTTDEVNSAINASTSGKVDTSTYTAYTASTESTLSGKQDTLSAGTNITINDNVISAAKYFAGNGINISSGNSISLNLPIWKGVSTSIIEGYEANKATSQYSHAEGYQTKAKGQNAHSEGEMTTASGYASHAEGQATEALKEYSHSEGYNTKANGEASHSGGYDTKTNNRGEFSSGYFNNSVSGSSSFGFSGNTLFSVGNGVDDDNRHNAFEIRQNGDIYFNDGTNDVKLQDILKGLQDQIDALRNG